MNQNFRRAFFYGMGGAYLIYLAYRMYKEQTVVGGMEPGILIATVLLFGVAGVALVAFAVYIWKRESDEEKKNSTGEPEQEEKE